MDAVDGVLNRLRVVTGAQEVPVHGMNRPGGLNRGTRRNEGLGQHLPTKHPVVRHLDAGAHECVGRTDLGAEGERLQHGGDTLVHGAPLDGGNSFSR